MKNETKFPIETTFSIKHFTSEEFEKYKKMHDNENTKIHFLQIRFWLDPTKKDAYSESKHLAFLLYENYRTHFTVSTVVEEDVKSGEIKSIEEMIKKIESQEKVIYEIYGYSGKAVVNEEEVELEERKFIADVVYDKVDMTLERDFYGKIKKSYFVTVFGELSNTDFEKEQPNDEFSK
jgi:hypothetical protein